MNYRHIYHAGNFADVFKHIVLVCLIERLKQKASPFCLLDTHAGIGHYDLRSIEAQKTFEHLNGISKIYMEEITISAIADYLRIVHEYNRSYGFIDSCMVYPGSPLFAQQLLRDNDRLVLCELHPDDYRALYSKTKQDHRINVHKMDGYVALNSLLPPREKCGLVLIDPSFELKNEFELIIKGVQKAQQKWQTGIYAIWYPIKESLDSNSFVRTLGDSVEGPILNLELSIASCDMDEGLIGSCMIIINPPWKIEEQFKLILPWLHDKLATEDCA